MKTTREFPVEEGTRKRGIYLLLLMLGSTGAAVAFVQNALNPAGATGVALTTAATAAICLALAGLTLWRRIPLAALEKLLLGVAVVVICVSVATGLYLTPPDDLVLRGVVATMLWMPLIFVFCAIAFDGVTSLRYSLAAYALIVLLTLPHAIATRSGTGVTDGIFVPLQAYLAYAVIIVALYFFSDLQERAFTMEETARTMRRLANTDALTTLANRRHAEEQFVRELRRAERYGRMFSVLMIDIDHFKDLNDRHGHHAGDEVLVDLARRIERMVRAADTIARWGGEEFLLLAPETSLADAQRLAEMIRHHVDANALAERYRITISLGVATYRAGDTVQSVVARADAALYLAKREGRNQARAEIPAGSGG
ncbi:MAG: GGDEF domain-containing protein [Trueperaceae bacterium]|nr:GGDEF domain-containing protein [Trueperaceae bacterium]